MRLERGKESPNTFNSNNKIHKIEEKCDASFDSGWTTFLRGSFGSRCKERRRERRFLTAGVGRGRCRKVVPGPSPWLEKTTRH